MCTDFDEYADGTHHSHHGCTTYSNDVGLGLHNARVQSCSFLLFSRPSKLHPFYDMTESSAMKETRSGKKGGKKCSGTKQLTLEAASGKKYIANLNTFGESDSATTSDRQTGRNH